MCVVAWGVTAKVVFGDVMVFKGRPNQGNEVLKLLLLIKNQGTDHIY